MKQRLCLAKTLVHDPPVLILDEPASGLDPRARLEMKALLNELRRMGKTILISSHILSELADFCTSIGIFEKGKLLAAGRVEEIIRKLHAGLQIEIEVAGDKERLLAVLANHAGAANPVPSSQGARCHWTARVVEAAPIVRRSTCATKFARMVMPKRTSAISKSAER